MIFRPGGTNSRTTPSRPLSRPGRITTRLAPRFAVSGPAGGGRTRAALTPIRDVSGPNPRIPAAVRGTTRTVNSSKALSLRRSRRMSCSGRTINALTPPTGVSGPASSRMISTR